MNSFFPILESKLNKSFDFVLDSKYFYVNKGRKNLSHLQCSLDTLFDEEGKIWGHCLFIDLFQESLAMYVRAYEEGKSKRPFDSSACILVEKKKGQGYNRQLSIFQLLHECVNTYKNACGVIKKEVWQVYYDPLKPRLLNTMCSTVDLTIQFLGKVSRIDADVLIHTTASNCYLNSSYATCIGLNVAKNNGLVMLGNGLEVELEGTINVHVKIQQCQSQISCLVTKLSDGFDLVLGDEWLEKHKAHIDYEFKAFGLHKGNKKITIQSVITNKKVFTQDKILSVLQFNRAVKKGCQPLLVQLKKVTDDGPSRDPSMERRKVIDDDPSTTWISNFRLEDSLVEPLIKEYDDIF